MLTYNQVPLAEVRGAYIRIEPHLHKMTWQPHIHWHPIDVFTSLTASISTLFFVHKLDECIGFVVLTPDGESVQVWIGQAFAGGVADLSLVDEGLVELLTSFGYKRMTFKTSRKGWAKVAPRLGWQPTMTEYSKELI